MKRILLASTALVAFFIQASIAAPNPGYHIIKKVALSAPTDLRWRLRRMAQSGATAAYSVA